MRLIRSVYVTALLSVVALLLPGRAEAWCLVDLDKCVVVDDEGNGFDDDDCVDPATAKSSDKVMWRYTVTNSSDWKWDLRNCELDDDTIGFHETIDVLYSPVDKAGPSSAVLYSDPAYCTEDVHNVATVTCECYWSPVAVDEQKPETKTATDEADLTCEVPPTPDFELEKECEDQTFTDDIGVNDFDVTVHNTGNAALECTLVGDGINDAAIPVCDESEPVYPCFTCDATELDVPINDEMSTTCHLYGLTETVTDTVGFECTAPDVPDYKMAKRASDECFVPPPTPAFEVTKECKDQFINKNTGVPTNAFDVTVENTGGVDLSCEIIGDGIDDAAIPQCENAPPTAEDSFPCWLCRTSDVSVDVGETTTANCAVYGLDETSKDTVGVKCTAPDYEMAKRASDECFVPEKIKDFTVQKVCYPQKPTMVNDFVVGVSNIGDVPLDCSIVGDGVNGVAIPLCEVDGDLGVASQEVCYTCDEDLDFTIPAKSATRRHCHLYGLTADSKDTVGVECTGPDDYKMAKRADATCQVPWLEISKTCEPAEDGDEVDFDGASGVFDVEITVMNKGTVDFTNCAITAEKILTDSMEPTSVDGDDELPKVECEQLKTGALAGGESTTLECTVYGLEETAMNFAEVTCGYAVDSSAARIVATTSEECTVEKEGCFTLTPGYWKTHPDIAALFFDSREFTSVLGGLEQMCLYPDGKVQLLRQCTAATLNMAVTDYLGGDCFATMPEFEKVYDRCCGDGPDLKISDETKCIEALDLFNNYDFGGIDDTSLCPNEDLGTSKPCGADPHWCDDDSKSLKPDFRREPIIRTPELRPNVERVKPTLRPRLQNRPTAR